MTPAQWVRRVVKPTAFLACLVPVVLIVVGSFTHGLGANPIEEITHRTGVTTLVLLLLTLAVTPVRRLTGVGVLMMLRRMLGLFAFFYACLHFSTYLVLDQFFAFDVIVEDVVERPYITVGFASFLLLVPLAITSTKGWIKRLGGKRWNRLHQLVYVTAAGGVLHFLWSVKADTRRPILFGLGLIILLGARLARARRWSRRGPVDSRDVSKPAWETR